jgi:hypothetical protein
MTEYSAIGLSKVLQLRRKPLQRDNYGCSSSYSFSSLTPIG